MIWHSVPDGDRDERVKVGVLCGSVLAALLAALLLRARNRVYRRLCEAEERDSDHDGTPDVYEILAGDGQEERQ